jgi:hypothetical protein
MECIDLLKPMGDIISLERELIHLDEVAMKIKNENN